MPLAYYKIKRELLRILKPVFPADYYAGEMNFIEQQVQRLQARSTLSFQVDQLFKAPLHTPAPRFVDVLIPVYNGYDYLNPCLQSVLQHTDLPFHIYIADDCSPDERVLPLLKEWTAKFPDKITLLTNTQNCGFAKTVNKLIAASSHDFVLLNTDTEVPPAWASRLFYPIFTDDKVASASPWTNSGSFQSFYFDHEDSSLDVALEDMDRACRDFSADLPLYFPNVTGFCMAISRKVVDEIGVLDEIYGRGYYEETDWCFRAGKAGFAHKLVPNLFVYHKGRSSFGENAFSQLLRKNRKIFTQRYPSAEKTLRLAKKNPLFALSSFVLLGRYLALKYPGFPAYTPNTPDAPYVQKQDNCYSIHKGSLASWVYQEKDPFPDFKISAK